MECCTIFQGLFCVKWQRKIEKVKCGGGAAFLYDNSTMILQWTSVFFRRYNIYSVIVLNRNGYICFNGEFFVCAGELYGISTHSYAASATGYSRYIGLITGISFRMPDRQLNKCMEWALSADDTYHAWLFLPYHPTYTDDCPGGLSVNEHIDW